jgi:hypothetical protein
MTAATGLTSNVVDLCRYMAAQFPGNPILLTDESKREMQRVHWLNKKTDAHYGIGCDIWKVGERQIVGHGGGYPGFITRIGLDTAEKIGVVVLTNALDTLAVTLTNGIFSTIQHFMRQGTNRRASRKRSPNFSRYEGRFLSRWGDTFVVNTGRQLVAFAPQSDKPMDDSVILEHTRGHEFRIASGSEFGYLGEKAIFRFGRKGQLIGLTWGPNPMEAKTT